MALAAFVRTVVSVDAPYDEYARGDPNALSPDEIRGMFLFADLGCPTCHTPPRFEREQYADAGIRTPGVKDTGRYDVTMSPADLYAMRVPTLRNLRETGPYFHDGSVTAISDAVSVMTKVFGTRAATTDEVAAVTTFLTKSLVDLSNSPERPLTVPSGLPVPLDGLEINR
jgi:cytochrome c peroxidase